ncbi:unnamed protein product [Onchocerca flexuosa]|uniref:Uncharacterized protein n=1 Tax=Onchocerca flexuosa TaxID=387005 RepID=A0A183I050_9BILA|nr:unnamed protein product [Onchocerca flexuosa]
MPTHTAPNGKFGCWQKCATQSNSNLDKKTNDLLSGYGNLRLNAYRWRGKSRCSSLRVLWIPEVFWIYLGN